MGSRANFVMTSAEVALEHGREDRHAKLEAEAKRTEEEAKQLQQKAKQLEKELNQEMFELVQNEQNRKRDGTWIDLHGLDTEFAVEKTQEFLLGARQAGIENVEVVIGGTDDM